MLIVAHIICLLLALELACSVIAPVLMKPSEQRETLACIDLTRVFDQSAETHGWKFKK